MILVSWEWTSGFFFEFIRVFAKISVFSSRILSAKILLEILSYGLPFLHELFVAVLHQLFQG
jgi:hypothetical protein